MAIPTQTTGVTPGKKEASLMKVESFTNLWVQRHVLVSSLVLWLLSRLTVLGSFLGTMASPGLTSIWWNGLIFFHHFVGYACCAFDLDFFSFFNTWDSYSFPLCVSEYWSSWGFGNICHLLCIEGSSSYPVFKPRCSLFHLIHTFRKVFFWAC